MDFGQIAGLVGAALIVLKFGFASAFVLVMTGSAFLFDVAQELAVEIESVEIAIVDLPAVSVAVLVSAALVGYTNSWMMVMKAMGLNVRQQVLVVRLPLDLPDYRYYLH